MEVSKEITWILTVGSNAARTVKYRTVKSFVNIWLQLFTLRATSYYSDKLINNRINYNNSIKIFSKNTYIHLFLINHYNSLSHEAVEI